MHYLFMTEAERRVQLGLDRLMADILKPAIVTADDTARARKSDPETSHEAADSNTNRAEVEAFVLSLLAEFGPLTDRELTVKYFAADEHPDADMESPRKRRSDLTKKGLVVATTERRPSRANRSATVWAAVDRD